MAARAPLVMPHAAASASRRPAMAPLASSLTAPCRRARGSRGFQQRTRRVRLLRPPAAAKSEAIGSTAEAAPVEGLTRKLQGMEMFDLSGKAVPVVDLWKDRKAVVAFARHFGCVLCRKRADLLTSKQDVMQAAGVTLVLIGPGSVEQVKAFCEQTKFKGGWSQDNTVVQGGIQAGLGTVIQKEHQDKRRMVLHPCFGCIKGDYLLLVQVSTTSCTSTRTKKPEMILTCRIYLGSLLFLDSRA